MVIVARVLVDLAPQSRDLELLRLHLAVPENVGILGRTLIPEYGWIGAGIAAVVGVYVGYWLHDRAVRSRDDGGYSPCTVDLGYGRFADCNSWND